MKSIHIEDLNTYTDEEIKSVIHKLNNELHERKKEQLRCAYARMETTLRDYFRVYEASNICIDDNFYSLDQLIHYLENNLC